MLYEGRKSGRQDIRQRPLARTIESAGQEQRSRVVIDAIAVRAIGHRMYRMLEQADIVAHR